MTATGVRAAGRRGDTAAAYHRPPSSSPVRAAAARTAAWTTGHRRYPTPDGTDPSADVFRSVTVDQFNSTWIDRKSLKFSPILYRFFSKYNPVYPADFAIHDKLSFTREVTRNSYGMTTSQTNHQMLIIIIENQLAT